MGETYNQKNIYGRQCTAAKNATWENVKHIGLSYCKHSNLECMGTVHHYAS